MGKRSTTVARSLFPTAKEEHAIFGVLDLYRVESFQRPRSRRQYLYMFVYHMSGVCTDGGGGVHVCAVAVTERQ